MKRLDRVRAALRWLSYLTPWFDFAERRRRKPQPLLPTHVLTWPHHLLAVDNADRHGFSPAYRGTVHRPPHAPPTAALDPARGIWIGRN